LHWNGEFAPWTALLAQGRDRARMVRPRRAYLVDPSHGFEGFVSFFAVATVADTFLLWAKASPDLGPLRELAPGLHEIEDSTGEQLRRPLCGIFTSGTTGLPKASVCFADTLEAVAIHYDAAVFRPIFDGSHTAGTFATCLPLQFSAAFFMVVLPAVFLHCDLLVFPPHDWRALCATAQRESVLCQSVPVLATAGIFSVPQRIDMHRTALFLGGGYISRERVRTICSRFLGIKLVNIYGTAETGAISLDREPGNQMHVGRPIPGKPVWIEEMNEHGIGLITTTGQDCAQFYWRPGVGLQSTGGVASNIDYGHFDEESNLYVDGRVDAGEKLHGILVYPRTIERHILRIPDVIDVRVRITHEYGGEHLSALVVGPVTPDLIREHCGDLPEIQRPARIQCISELDAESAYSAHGKL
jgi:acyl-coenzyme A synthetase/AMP-(fatty) acid ligase